MPKLIPMNRLLIATVVFLFSCSNNKTKAPVLSKNSSQTSEQRLSDNIKATPETNKDPQNNEWNKNVYRNKLYKFRIEFPIGWEYDAGTSSTTLARSLDRTIGATISVLVSHTAEHEKPSNPNNIVASIPVTTYKNDINKVMASLNTKAENLKVEIASLNKFPAYLVSYTAKPSADKSYTFLFQQIHCFHNGLLYQISMSIPNDFYSSDIELLYESTIKSFYFENAN